MRITFKTEGGIAYFPGLSRPTTIELEELPAEESRELKELVEKARFFELPEEVSKPSRGAADYRSYEITVEEEGGRSHTIRVAEPLEDPDLERLVSFLRARTRIIPGDS